MLQDYVMNTEVVASMVTVVWQSGYTFDANWQLDKEQRRGDRWPLPDQFCAVLWALVLAA